MKIRVVIMLVLVGLLVLSGFGVAAITNLENNPPDKPIIDGPGRWPARVELCYTVESIDYDGDNIMFIIDWGDGTLTETDYVQHNTPIEVCHTYEKTKKYIIRAMAKDIFGAESEWTYFETEISINNTTINISSLMFIERFIIIEKILLIINFIKFREL